MSTDNTITPYPYLRHPKGDKEMYCVSPIHGRSFLIKQQNDGRCIISKGNGLSYTQYPFLNTGEMCNDTWGLLLIKDALRDFQLGNEIASLGIKTNKMEYVLELDTQLHFPSGPIKPVILQYDVECPYRICDAPFMDASQIWNQVRGWDTLNDKRFNEAYLIAATVLIRNLRILHDNEILHNAIHVQNYTWALELLDFELACSPSHPYDRADDQRHVKDLFPREVIQTYEIINFIAGVLHEDIDYKKVDAMFEEYGFEINTYIL